MPSTTTTLTEPSATTPCGEPGTEGARPLITLSGAEVQKIALGALGCLTVVAASGLAAAAFGAEHAVTSIVAITTATVSALASIATGLFGLRAVSESSSNFQRALEAVETADRKSQGEGLLAELESAREVTRVDLFRARRNGISFAEVAEATGKTEAQLKEIFRNKEG